MCIFFPFVFFVFGHCAFCPCMIYGFCLSLSYIQQKQLHLAYLLTFNSNLTTMINYLPKSMTKKRRLQFCHYKWTTSWRVPQVAQELLSLPGHLSSLPVFRGVHVVRSLVFIVFCKALLVFYPFSFSHCIVCPSIYGFWLPRWCLQTSLDSSISSTPLYEVYISQLIRNTRACNWYSHFLQQHRLLSTILLSQEFIKNRHILSFKTFCGRYQHLVQRYSVTGTDDEIFKFQFDY